MVNRSRAQTAIYLRTELIEKIYITEDNISRLIIYVVQKKCHKKKSDLSMATYPVLAYQTNPITYFFILHLI